MNKEIEEKQLDYYLVGTRENIIVSSSSLSFIDPSQGGSPTKYLSFFDKQVEKDENKSLENGKIIHLYSEKPDEFAISKVNKPDGSIADMAIEFYNLCSNYDGSIKVNTDIISELKTENGRSAEILSITAAYEKLGKLLDIEQNQLINLFRQARVNTNAYRTYKEDTLINKFISECIDYLKDLTNLEGKISLTQSDKFTIESCIKSLRANELANKYFNLSGLFDTNYIVKEKEVYFQLLGLECKAKLDNIYVDLENRIIYLNDLKTTSKPISLFQNTLEFYRYYRQLAFYKRALIWLIKNQKLMVGYGNMFDNFEIVCQIIVVETTGNFESQVFNIDNYILKGEEEVKSLLGRIKYHIENNQWTRNMEDIQGKGVITLKPIENGTSN